MDPLTTFAEAAVAIRWADDVLNAGANVATIELSERARIPEPDREALVALLAEEGEYEVFIDSTLKDGSLTYGECLIVGESEDEFLLSAHICHPSLANDNLSGIALLTRLGGALSSISTSLAENHRVELPVLDIT